MHTLALGAQDACRTTKANAWNAFEGINLEPSPNIYIAEHKGGLESLLMNPLLNKLKPLLNLLETSDGPLI